MSGPKVEDYADRVRRGAPPTDEEFEPVPRPARLPRMSDALVDADKLRKAGAPQNPLRSGFVELDAAMTHWGPGEVTMLAADSGIGKSTLGTQFALHASNARNGGVYFNLEMPSASFGLRAAANFTRLKPKKVMAGKLDEDEDGRFTVALEALRLAASRIVLGNQMEHRTTAAIRSLCERAKAELDSEGTPLSYVVIDHVLQILVKARSDDKDGAGKERADLLKEIAESLKVHVLALVHITRDGSKSGKMPTKNDLASSAWFDRHADNILIFHQRRDSDGTFLRDVPAILSCQKSRWGEPASVSLTYQGGFFYPWVLGGGA